MRQYSKELLHVWAPWYLRWLRSGEGGHNFLEGGGLEGGVVWHDDGFGAAIGIDRLVATLAEGSIGRSAGAGHLLALVGAASWLRR